jgi:hypothetical protein
MATDLRSPTVPAGSSSEELEKAEEGKKVD